MAKLTHLCFVDDMIMCCKGDINSVQLLLNAFQTFSVASDLQANKVKSEIFCCGMKEDEVQQLLSDIGFSKGRMPFKYLGVLICSKRILAKDCDILLEKMIARIRGWSSRNISFIGRVQLINSMLMSIHLY